MPGKLIENLKYQRLFLPVSRTTANTLYNGQANTVTGNSIDTKEYDEVNIHINAGTLTGAATLTPTITESDTDLPSGSTAVTSAAFTVITASNDETVRIGSVKCQSTKRYLWLKVVKATAEAAVYGAIAILGKADTDPQSNSEDFDV